MFTRVTGDEVEMTSEYLHSRMDDTMHAGSGDGEGGGGGRGVR